MTITKSRDDSCSSFLRAKLIRKEKRSAISSQFMNPPQDLPTNCILQQSHESIQDFSSTPLLQKSHPTEMLSFLAKKDKNKPSTYKPKVPPKYWTFFANHITRMTEIIIMSLFTNSSRQLRRITEQC
jgi:hypothetical protein